VTEIGDLNPRMFKHSSRHSITRFWLTRSYATNKGGETLENVCLAEEFAE
jgi:hypothetical protein